LLGHWFFAGWSPSMAVSLIAALSRNRVIGKDKALPWRLPEDLRRFKALTVGHPVVMGRKTYESILQSLGKPLPGRENIVVTRSTDYKAPGCRVVHSLDAALNVARTAPGGEECCVIGGEEIFRLAFPLADRLELTEIHRDYEGDAWFPEYDGEQWTETAREAREYDGIAYDFVTYQRRPMPK
jgi:dihydrofolate reductase